MAIFEFFQRGQPMILVKIENLLFLLFWTK